MQHAAIAPHHDGAGIAQRFGEPFGGGVVAQQKRIVPQRRAGGEIGREPDPRFRRALKGRQGHHVAQERAGDAVHVGAALVDLLVTAHFAQHAVGQRPVDRHHRAGIVRPDQPHRLRCADQETVRLQPRADMAEGVSEVVAPERAGGHAYADLRAVEGFAQRPEFRFAHPVSPGIRECRAWNPRRRKIRA